MPIHYINPQLVKIAQMALNKAAFVGQPQLAQQDQAAMAQGGAPPGAMPPGMPPGAMPPGMPPGADPAAMGMPPGMDPAAMGGAPPGMDPAAMGGMPPGMDPSMMGAAPPMDPAAMGAAPPAAGGGMDPEAIRAIIREELQSMGGGGAGKPKSKGSSKDADMYQVYMLLNTLTQQMGLESPEPQEGDYMAAIKQTLVKMFTTLGLQVPPEALLAPPVEGQAPAEGGGKSESGSSEQKQEKPPESSIKPIEPLQPAIPAPQGGPQQKMAAIGRVYSEGSERMASMQSRAAAISKMLQMNRAS